MEEREAEKESFELQNLARYWYEYIEDVIVDRNKAIDSELAELQ